MEDMARLAVIEQNTPTTEAFNKALHALIQHITNILDFPHDVELRKIKNGVIKDSLNLEGFADYLKYIGFEVIGNELIYPMRKSLNDLRTSQAAMQRKLHFVVGTSSDNSKKNMECEMEEGIYELVLEPSKILTTKNEFLLRLENLFNDVLKYEDEDLQEFARLHIPIVTLQIKAMERMRESQKLIKTGQSKGPEFHFDIALLTELLEWFKYSFFKWVDSPCCQKCGHNTTFKETTTMKTETETCRVEVYICKSCAALTNFPRHNCPWALLKSKKGRCGEWAACFTLLCRSLHYDTRYVYDTTDHVWCEVFDYDGNRWLHVDPCEAKLDQPLIYEHGWGKKIEYVIAFSRDDIQDVTWRYSSHHREVRKRRMLCSDLELVDTIMLLRTNRQKQVSGARRKYLTKRTVQELAQMLVERKPSDYENEGRVSGSLGWRQQRGELGETKRHIFDFKEVGHYSIQYVTSKDEYRISKNGAEYKIIKTWCDGTFEADNVFRKEEKDWKMVYLAREKGASHGYLSWKVCTTLGNLSLSSLSISAVTGLFESGIITWSLQFDDEEPLIFEIKETPRVLDRRFRTLILKAELTGGKGDVSWQHAQLFRQSLMDSNSTLCLELTVNQQSTK